MVLDKDLTLDTEGCWDENAWDLHKQSSKKYSSRMAILVLSISAKSLYQQHEHNYVNDVSEDWRIISRVSCTNGGMSSIPVILWVKGRGMASESESMSLMGDRPE